MKSSNSQVSLYTILKNLGLCGLLFVAATASAQEYPPNYDPARFGKAMSVLNDGNGEYAGLEIDCIDSKGHVIEESSATIPKDAELRSHFPWENENALKFRVWLDVTAIGENLPKGQYSLCTDDKTSAVGEKYKPLLTKESNTELYNKYCAPNSKVAMFQPATMNSKGHRLRAASAP